MASMEVAQSEKETEKGLPTFKELVGTEMVDIYVGPTKEHFHVHKAILCARVPYFDKMFNGGFVEASTNSATFPEDTVKSFDLLLGWVYCNTVQPLKSIETETGRGDSWNVCDLYSLAEKMGVPQLQDRIIDMKRDIDWRNEAIPTRSTILEVYKTTSSRSGYRKYVSHAFAYGLLKLDGEPYEIDSLGEFITKDVELAQDVLSLLRTTSGEIDDPTYMVDCKFHCHAKGEPCYKYDEDNSSEPMARAWQCRC